jgi:hypothetical protein
VGCSRVARNPHVMGADSAKKVSGLFLKASPQMCSLDFGNYYSTSNNHITAPMASAIASHQGRVLGQAILGASPAASALPGFLIPAWQGPTSRRHFSATSKRPSKLGRTPLTVPPGVEITMSDPITKRKATAWNPTIHKTITVKGPLGAFSLTFWKRLDVWGQGD